MSKKTTPPVAVDYKRDADDCCHCEKCGAVEPGVFRECSACAAARKAEWDAGMPERLTQQAVEDAACEATYDLALDRVAAHALAERMSAISEDCYCAGWMILPTFNRSPAGKSISQCRSARGSSSSRTRRCAVRGRMRPA